MSEKEPTRDEMVGARVRFAQLLSQPGTPEPAFQSLFSECPYILSKSLPLQLRPSQLIPARPGRSEADFTVFPSGGIPTAAVIELKRPDHKLVTGTRKALVQFTREAETAISQCLAYSTKLKQRLDHSRCAIIGNDVYRFVIMGLRESIQGVDADVLELLYQRASGCTFIPYDLLLEEYSGLVPARVALLVPVLPRRYHTLYVSLPRSTLDLSVQRLGNEVVSICTQYAGAEMPALCVSSAGPLPTIPQHEAVLGADAFLLISSGEVTRIQSEEYETAVKSGKDRWTLGVTNGPSEVARERPSPMRLIPRPRATRYYDAVERIWMRPLDRLRAVLVAEILPNIREEILRTTERPAVRRTPEFM